MGLLIALPLSFYFSSTGQDGGHAFVAGGVGMAFSISGATLFSILSSREVDQRLVLSGYRPIELLLGRLLFLGPFGLVVAAGFATLMWTVSNPMHPWLLAYGVAAVALVAVPFGLAIGAAVPNELEGTLVLIGVVGVQLAAPASATASKVLPFYGPRRLIDASDSYGAAIAWPSILAVAYALTLLALARLFVSQRVTIQRHESVSSS
ncbi:MAG: ABC transporter permease [Acidimicrobiales bacterium]